jgi:hypothetical protein
VRTDTTVDFYLFLKAWASGCVNLDYPVWVIRMVDDRSIISCSQPLPRMGKIADFYRIMGIYALNL